MMAEAGKGGGAPGPGEDGKRLLMDRLDENLRYHAETVDHLDIGSIYYLQALSGLHYYLKTEHGFSAAEVKALLYFEDPLEAVFHCKEENTHAGRFPICEFLVEIDAYRRFRKMPESPQLEKRHRELGRRLKQNLDVYKGQLHTWDRDELIDKARLIGAALEAYDFMEDGYQPRMEEVEFLLQFEEPLRLLQAYWAYDTVSAGEGMIRALMGGRAASLEQESLPASLKEKLQKAAQEAKAWTGPEKGAHGQEAR